MNTRKMTFKEFTQRYDFNPSAPSAQLGKGGFGKVYKAYDTVKHRWVAVKISEVDMEWENVSLRAEVQKARSLPAHPNIMHYEHCCRFDMPNGTFDYGIMQYYEHGNLAQLMQAAFLTAAQKEAIARGFVRGVHFIHQHRIVHRDLKPSNILMAKRGGNWTPLIADFGLSKAVSEKEALATAFDNTIIGGSLAYASPEQLKGQRLSFSTDHWSLGVIVYQLFTGQLPFQRAEGPPIQSAVSMYHLISSSKRLEHLRIIPEPWQSFCEQCLTVDPKRRVVNAEAVLGASTTAASSSSFEQDHPHMEEEATRLEEKKTAAALPPLQNQAKPKPGKALYYWGAAFILLGLVAAFLVWPYETEEAPLEPPGAQLIPARAASGLWGYQQAGGAWKIQPRFQKAEVFNAQGEAEVVLDTLGNTHTLYINRVGQCVAECPEKELVEERQEEEVAVEEIASIIQEVYQIDEINERAGFVHTKEQVLKVHLSKNLQVLQGKEFYHLQAQSLEDFIKDLIYTPKDYKIVRAAKVRGKIDTLYVKLNE